ncbi:MAG: hypothetical protein EDM05_001940 [Leptolyngbya sp. IPPAS B-1204]|nr:hypothetical protein [Elainella sp. C42_A2020_010]RNJ67497.1 MAG: hypothetical protein EDM05_20140 [Leptolyngbya sp. IPPAS B-1204]
MNHYCYAWIEDWCKENGWTELFMRRRNEYWAFPPNGVMPLPIPQQVLRQIKAERGLSSDERVWCVAAGMVALAAAGLSFLAQSPMPLVTAFAFCAMVVAGLETEE